VQKNTEALLVAGKETGLEANDENNTRYSRFVNNMQEEFTTMRYAINNLNKSVHLETALTN
jgi:hypothetical protein